MVVYSKAFVCFLKKYRCAYSILKALVNPKISNVYSVLMQHQIRDMSAILGYWGRARRCSTHKLTDAVNSDCMYGKNLSN